MFVIDGFCFVLHLSASTLLPYLPCDRRAFCGFLRSEQIRSFVSRGCWRATAGGSWHRFLFPCPLFCLPFTLLPSLSTVCVWGHSVTLPELGTQAMKTLSKHAVLTVPGMTTWLWPAQHGHRTSPALPVSRLPTGQLSLHSPHQPSRTDTIPSLCVSLCKQVRSQHSDFLCTPPCQPQPLEAFPVYPGTVGQLWARSPSELRSRPVGCNHTFSTEVWKGPITPMSLSTHGYSPSAQGIL